MRRGFTLIEVLLGLALLALVVTLVQGVYSAVSRSRQRIGEQTEGAHAAALLLHRMADELSSARSVGASSATSGSALLPVTLDSDSGGDSRLEFTTVLPKSLQEEAAPTTQVEGFVRVGYSVDEGESGARQLVRTDSRSGEEGPGGEPVPDAVLPHVTRFKVLLSADGEKWVQSWDGSEAAGADAVPRLVSLEVAWKEGKSGEGPERSLRTMAVLYGVPEP